MAYCCWAAQLEYINGADELRCVECGMSIEMHIKAPCGSKIDIRHVKCSATQRAHLILAHACNM